MLLTEAFELYRLDYIVFKNQSAKTEENHYVCLRALISFCGDIPVENLTYTIIRDWKISLDKGRSTATVSNYITKLRVVLMYLKKRGYTVIDPDIIPVPKRLNKVPEYLTKDQVAYLIAKTRRLKNKTVISMLYASGLRVSELCSLDRGSIIAKSFTVVGKGNKIRPAYIDERTRTLLDLYLESRTDNNPALFLQDDGTRITPGSIQGSFRALRDITGIKVHPHALRHSYATDLMNNGIHIFVLSRLLGHASIATTQRYLHVADIQLQAEYEKHHTT